MIVPNGALRRGISGGGSPTVVINNHVDASGGTWPQCSGSRGLLASTSQSIRVKSASTPPRAVSAEKNTSRCRSTSANAGERSMWRIAASAVMGGQSTTRAFQVVRLDARAVGGRMAQHRDPHRRPVRTFHAIAAQAENGVMRCRSCCDKRQFPARSSAVFRLPAAAAAFRRDAVFDDSGYAQAVVVSTVLIDAGLRVTALTVQLASGGRFARRRGLCDKTPDLIGGCMK